MSRRTVGLAANALLAAVSTALALGAAEWAARAFDLSQTWASYVGSPRFLSNDMITPDVIGYRRLPGSEWSAPFGTTIRSNREGFRDVEHPDSSATGELRLLFLGDSVTEGYGVEMDERYAPLVAQKLAAALGRAVRPIVMGVAAYGTVDEMATLTSHGLAARPDLVVLQTGYGDVLENAGRKRQYLEHRWSEPRPNVEQSARPSDTGGVIDFLRAHSALYLTVAERWNTLKLRRGTARGDLARIETLAPDDLAFSSAVLGDLADTLAAHGIPLLVAEFPVESELLFPDTTAGATGRRWIEQALDSRPGVAIVDLRPALRGEGGEVPPFLDNVHPTAEGHARAAEAVAGAALGLIRP